MGGNLLRSTATHPRCLLPSPKIYTHELTHRPSNSSTRKEGGSQLTKNWENWWSGSPSVLAATRLTASTTNKTAAAAHQHLRSISGDAAIRAQGAARWARLKAAAYARSRPPAPFWACYDGPRSPPASRRRRVDGSASTPLPLFSDGAEHGGSDFFTGVEYFSARDF